MKNIETIVRLGFTPANLLKRSTWGKVTRVMNWFVSKNLVVATTGEVKYGLSHGLPVTDAEIKRLVREYLNSPINEHTEELHSIASSLGVKVTNSKVLTEFCNYASN